MVTILMTSAEMDNLGLLKIKASRNKVYDIISYFLFITSPTKLFYVT